MVDSISLSFRIPEKKVSKLKGLLDSAIQAGYSSFRELARIAGTIILVTLAVGPISRLLTRQMYFAVETRSAWDNTIHFSLSLQLELKFWCCNIDCLNGYSIRPPLATHTVVFSDASDVAFGGFSPSLDGTIVSGMWEPEDIGQSSTFRELKAIYVLLLSYVAQLKRKRVKIITDNQGAAKIVAIGSSKINLQALAMDIFNLCLVNSIILEAQWIPRSLTERADLLSRFVDKDDWSVNPSVFRVIDAKWGPHTIDRFASHYNAQVPRFISKFASPRCSGVDALAQDWLDEKNWVCSPVSAIVPSVRALVVLWLRHFDRLTVAFGLFLALFA